MPPERQPMDLEAYTARAQRGPCFVCAFVSGRPDFAHHTVYEDDDHVAFLDRWPTLPGKVLVAPKRHIEHVVRDLDPESYTRLMLVVREVALAVEDCVGAERTYLYSLGSQQGNAHLHWHIAGLPPDTPYEQQQFASLMTENGVLAMEPEETSAMAARIRNRIAARGRLNAPGRG
ncbi:HIT family protein [Streptomyces sp. NBS 14/10]|uniref:HIT family protein n=1 Tax=Streptomyces sp. NBS 14/10 TaxID=1945643 RepID=UPI00211AD232|nr:HIT family protein [Streptomyces sp. NBS 14/10]KAK1182226.1 HIT family protein [Streptomyces sp. NBS 14/10]